MSLILKVKRIELFLMLYFTSGVLMRTLLPEGVGGEYTAFILPFFIISSFILWPNIRLSLSQAAYLGIFFITALASFVVNGSTALELIQYVTLVLGEVFLILIIFSHKIDVNYRKILGYIFVVNFIVTIFDFLVLGLFHDKNLGLFYGNGFGAHLSGLLQILIATYFLNTKTKPYIKVLIVFLTLVVVVISDAKQAILIVGFAYFLTLLLRLKFLNILLFSFALFLVYFYGVYIIDIFFKSITQWIDFDKMTEGFFQKLVFFDLLSSSNMEFFQWVIGNGPSSGASKSAIIFNNESNLYGHILEIQNNYLYPSSSSTFSFFSSNNGLLTDLGLLGLISYWLLISKVLRVEQNTDSIVYLIILFVAASIGIFLESYYIVMTAFLACQAERQIAGKA